VPAGEHRSAVRVHPEPVAEPRQRLHARRGPGRPRRQARTSSSLASTDSSSSPPRPRAARHEAHRGPSGGGTGIVGRCEVAPRLRGGSFSALRVLTESVLLTVVRTGMRRNVRAREAVPVHSSPFLLGFRRGLVRQDSPGRHVTPQPRAPSQHRPGCVIQVTGWSTRSSSTSKTRRRGGWCAPRGHETGDATRADRPAESVAQCDVLGGQSVALSR
jgi:hypothetical protein